MLKIVILTATIAYCLVFISSKEYGPFDLRITKVVMCKGPKSKDCAVLDVQKWSNTKGLTINVDVIENCSPQVSKVTAISKGKQLVRLQMNNPCEHLFLRPMLERFLNASEHCIVRKGEFDLKIVRALTCKGPKVKNCASVGIELWDNGKGLFMNIKVIENFSPQVSKVTAVSKGKQLVRLQMNNPCEHLFLRPLLETIFNVTKHCIIKKGTYSYEINIEKVAKDYFGGSFVYGNLTFKSAMYSRDCNLSCVNLDVMMYPTESSQ